MKQLESVELFVCSEDATQQIGLADKVEVWTEGGSSHLILRGVDGVDKDAVLQAENECLRRDVEFYKRLWQARCGATTPVERQPEVDERKFIEVLEDYAACRITHVDVADTAGVALVDPEPTNKERLAQLIGGGTKANKQYADGLAEYLDDMGVTAPEDNA